MVLLAGSIGQASTGGPPIGMSLSSSASGVSLSIETRKSSSLGRSLAGCAKAGRAARLSPRNDTIVRKPRRVDGSIQGQLHA
jgi:hypothetical protein